MAAHTHDEKHPNSPPRSTRSSSEPTMVGYAPPPGAMEEGKVAFVPYRGEGTAENPYIVDWLEGERDNPQAWGKTRKWSITLANAIATLCVAFASSAYSGGAAAMVRYFEVKQIIIVAGITVFVLGFALGPLLWAPLSEMYGRRRIFIVSYGPFAIFNIGCALARNIETLLVCRFFAGSFGSSVLVNAGGVLADMFPPQERGIATVFFALAPFMGKSAGPVLGPICGGFLSYASWRDIFWLLFAFAGAMFIITLVIMDKETYAPVLLRRKAKKLSKETGKHYVGKYDEGLVLKKSEIFKVNLTRPFVLLFLEPIVLLISIWLAIVYGTLYLCFAAFPIVFQQEERGWGPGVGGLAFIGMGIGMVLGAFLAPMTNRMYVKACEKSPTGRAPPEARLPMVCIAGVLLPIGLFWFAWTTFPSVHWIVPIIATVPFGMGMLILFTGSINYLIDAYLLYAASALAANSVLRSLFGAVFPLFTSDMYHNLGTQWASSIPAFLALACVPIPFAFYKWGAKIRAKSRYAPKLPLAPLPPQEAEPEPELAEQMKVEPEERA